MPTTYTLPELAEATASSKRTIYYYVSRGLLPQAGRGRQTRYGDEHYWRLLVIRALADMSIPLEVIQRHLEGVSLEHIKLLASPLIPLEELRVGLQEQIGGIRHKLEPTSDLDLSNLGLEDPVALRHRLSALEEQAQRVKSENDKVRGALYANLASAHEGRPGGIEAWVDVDANGAPGRDLAKLIDDLNRLVPQLERIVLSLDGKAGESSSATGFGRAESSEGAHAVRVGEAVVSELAGKLPARELADEIARAVEAWLAARDSDRRG